MVLLIVLASCSFGRSQEVGTAATVDSIYRNFLGNWQGSSERLVDGQRVQETIELAVTEQPKRHQLVFDYLYNHKANAPKMRRFLTLNPSKEIVTMRWDGVPSEDRCTASGLKEFSQIGFGDFTAICDDGGAASNHRRDRVTFHLGIDTLDYEWAESVDGQAYKTYSTFSFKRRL
jgi:hypothetical protein